MTNFGRLLLIVVIIASLGAVSASPSIAQKFLGFSRSVCEGDVKIPNSDLSVRRRESQIVVVKRESIVTPTGVVPVVWQCNDVQQPIVNCPAGTTKVMFDRTQGGRLVTIICLKR